MQNNFAYRTWVSDKGSKKFAENSMLCSHRPNGKTIYDARNSDEHTSRQLGSLDSETTRTFSQTQCCVLAGAMQRPIETRSNAEATSQRLAFNVYI